MLLALNFSHIARYWYKIVIHINTYCFVINFIIYTTCKTVNSAPNACMTGFVVETILEEGVNYDPHLARHRYIVIYLKFI